MAWKYRQLRKCAGSPYQDGEPASIDIEALLLHKAVKADLGIRKGKNKDGVEQDYQDVKYKVTKVVATPVQPTPQPGSVFAEPVVQPAPAKATKKKAPAQPAPVVEEAPVVVESATQVDINDDSDWD
jgi:hypothetical protein